MYFVFKHWQAEQDLQKNLQHWQAKRAAKASKIAHRPKFVCGAEPTYFLAHKMATFNFSPWHVLLLLHLLGPATSCGNGSRVPLQAPLPVTELVLRSDIEDGAGIQEAGRGEWSVRVEADSTSFDLPAGATTCPAAQVCPGLCCSNGDVCYLGQCRKVTELRGLINVSTSRGCTAAFGRLVCWGLHVEKADFSVHPPHDMGVGDDVAYVGGGYTRLCFVTHSGGLACISPNSFDCSGFFSSFAPGQETTEGTLLCTKDSPSPLVSVRVGMDALCVVDCDSQVSCVGNGYVWEEDGTGTLTFQPLSFLPPTIEIDTRLEHLCLLLSSGSVYCSGFNIYGELSGAPSSFFSGVVPGSPDVATYVATSFSYSCAIDAEGRLWCWGDMLSGDCEAVFPTGPTGPSEVPTPAGTRWLAVSPIQSDLCALADTGDIFCLGCGVSTTHYSYLSFMGETAGQWYQVPLPEQAVALDGENYSHCALLRSGRVFCWGLNDDGQLGTGDEEYHYGPQEVLWPH